MSTRLSDYLPNPAGFALWLYAAAFVILPMLLAYKGFAYILGTVLFAVGLRPHVMAMVEGREAWFGLSWGKRHWGRTIRLKLGSEEMAVRLTTWFLVLLTLFGLPVIIWVVQYQGQVFHQQFQQHLPVVLKSVGELLGAAHDRLPGIVPEVNVEEKGGWSGLSDVFMQVFGNAAAGLKSSAGDLAADGLKVLGEVFGDWVKLVISAIIIGTLLGNWDKEVAMHRGIISRGIQSESLRANVLRYGELYQDGISLFMIGYLEVAFTLSFLFVIAMIALPLGLGLGTILFMAVILGFVTAVPKIGGILAMVLAFLLMCTNIDPGLGWFGYDLISFGWGWDVVIRTVLMMIVAKLMGFLEAYNFTPEIIGARLGMTKVQIIATILIWAIGAGFFGMIWGILLSLAFQAALRLSLELAGEASAEDPVKRDAAE